MSETAVNVRRATRDDIDAIAAFNLAMARETEGLSLDEPTLRRGVAAVFEEPGHGFYLVAEAGGTPAGCMMITFEWSDWRNAQWWWIQSVYVDEPFRRRGVYRAMHEHAAAAARSAGGVRGLRLYVERNNTRAQQTYHSLGMSETIYKMFQDDFLGSH